MKNVSIDPDISVMNDIKDRVLSDIQVNDGHAGVDGLCDEALAELNKVSDMMFNYELADMTLEKAIKALEDEINDPPLILYGQKVKVRTR